MMKQFQVQEDLYSFLAVEVREGVKMAWVMRVRRNMSAEPRNGLIIHSKRAETYIEYY